MENNNWGAPQQQGAQWPGAAGFQPALGPYAAYGAYPPMAPRAYPMLMAAPAQQAMLGAAPAQQLAPPPPPLPRAAPKDISTWLDEVKPGYGEKYASIFEDLGVDDEDAAKMHSACLNEEIDLLLKDGELTDSDAERLDQLASVLGISNEDASQAIAAKTVPIYVDATRKAVDNAIAADEAAQKALGADSASSLNFNVTPSRRWRLHEHTRVHASRDGVRATQAMNWKR